MGEFIQNAIPKPVYTFFYGTDAATKADDTTTKVDQVGQTTISDNAPKPNAIYQFYENVKMYFYNIGTGFSMIYNLFFLANIISLEDCLHVFTTAGRTSLIDSLKGSDHGVSLLLDHFEGFNIDNEEDLCDLLVQGFNVKPSKALSFFKKSEISDEANILKVFDAINFKYYSLEEFDEVFEKHKDKLSDDSTIKLYTQLYKEVTSGGVYEKLNNQLEDDGFISKLNSANKEIKQGFLDAIAENFEVEDLTLSKLDKDDATQIAEKSIPIKINSLITKAAGNSHVPYLDTTYELTRLQSMFVSLDISMTESQFFQTVVKAIKDKSDEINDSGSLTTPVKYGLSDVLRSAIKIGLASDSIEKGLDGCEDDPEQGALSIARVIASINVSILGESFDTPIIAGSSEKTFFSALFVNKPDNSNDLVSQLVEQGNLKGVERFITFVTSDLIDSVDGANIEEASECCKSVFKHIGKQYPLLLYALANKLDYYNKHSSTTFSFFSFSYGAQADKYKATVEFGNVKESFLSALKEANDTLLARSKRTYADTDDQEALSKALVEESELRAHIINYISRENVSDWIEAIFSTDGIFKLDDRDEYLQQVGDYYTEEISEEDFDNLKLLLLCNLSSTRDVFKEVALPKISTFDSEGGEDFYENVAKQLIVTVPRNAMDYLDVLVAEGHLDEGLAFLADHPENISKLFNLDWKDYITKFGLSTLNLVDPIDFPDAKDLNFDLPKVPEDSKVKMDDLLVLYQRYKKLQAQHDPSVYLSDCSYNLQLYVDNIRNKMVPGLNYLKTDKYLSLENNLISSLYALDKMLDSDDVDEKLKLVICKEYFAEVDDAAPQCVSPYQRNVPGVTFRRLKNFLPAPSVEEKQAMDILQKPEKILAEEVKKIVGSYAYNMAEVYFSLQSYGQDPYDPHTRHKHANFMNDLKKNVVNIPFDQSLYDDDVFIGMYGVNFKISDQNRKKLLKELSKIALIKVIQDDFAAKGLFGNKDKTESVEWSEQLGDYIKYHWEGIPGKDYEEEARENLIGKAVSTIELKVQSEKRTALTKLGTLLLKLEIKAETDNTGFAKNLKDYMSSKSMDNVKGIAADKYEEVLKAAKIDRDQAEKEVEDVTASQAKVFMNVSQSVNKVMLSYTETDEYAQQVAAKRAEQGIDDITDADIQMQVGLIKMSDGIRPLYGDPEAEDWDPTYVKAEDKGLSAFVVDSLLKEAGIAVN